MSLGAARSQAHDAARSLDAAWQHTSDRWRDAAARAFHEDHVAPAEPALRAAMLGFARIADVIEQARRECT